MVLKPAAFGLLELRPVLLSILAPSFSNTCEKQKQWSYAGSMHMSQWLDLEKWDGVMTIPASISTIDFQYSTAPRARDFRVNAETFNDMIFRPIS